MSLPFTSITVKPKDKNLSLSGSTGLTSSVFPVIWSLFLSMIVVKLSSLYFDAVIAASQTEPSESSPSPSRVNTRYFFLSVFNPKAIPTATDNP